MAVGRGLAIAIGAIVLGMGAGAIIFMLIECFVDWKYYEPEPAGIAAYIARFRPSPMFERLGEHPTRCRRDLKQRMRCIYRSGDVELVVGWTKKLGKPRSLMIRRPEIPDSTPFQWADLHQTLPLLCKNIDPQQAAALVRSVAGASWGKWDKDGKFPLVSEVESSQPDLTANATGCWLKFGQEITRSAILSQVEVRPAPMD